MATPSLSTGASWCYRASKVLQLSEHLEPQQVRGEEEGYLRLKS